MHKICPVCEFILCSFSNHPEILDSKLCSGTISKQDIVCKLILEKIFYSPQRLFSPLVCVVAECDPREKGRNDT